MNIQWKKNCPKCGKEQVYSSKYTLKYSILKNTLCNKCNQNKKKIVIPSDGWSKLCPKCGEKQLYSCKSIYTSSLRKNKVCINCTVDKSKKHRGKFERICKCGKLLKYSCRQSLNLAKKHNALCIKCATQISAKKIDRSFQKTEEYRKMMSESIKRSEKHKNMYTEEVREKLRIAKLKQIEKLGTQTNYNLKACQFIDLINDIYNWNLQHAKNGGEVKVSGYSLDGYDKNKKIIFEYDEPKHNKLHQMKKDRIRENRIIQKIHPYLFIRYNEEYDELYSVDNKEITKCQHP